MNDIGSSAVAATSGELLLSHFMTESEMALEVKRSRRQLYRWRKAGNGPPWIKVGDAVYYSRTGFIDWLQRKLYSQQQQQTPRKRPKPVRSAAGFRERNAKVLRRGK